MLLLLPPQVPSGIMHEQRGQVIRLPMAVLEPTARKLWLSDRIISCVRADSDAAGEEIGESVMRHADSPNDSIAWLCEQILAVHPASPQKETR